MILQPFAQTLRKTLGKTASDYLHVHISGNETLGFIHVANAALFLGATNPLLSDIVHFRNNSMVVAHGARNAGEVTDALEQISKFLIEREAIKPSDELLRVSPEWVDEPWDAIRDVTPVCNVRLARFLGLPQVSSGLVTRCDETKTFKLSQRAEGKASGQYDLIAMGKNEAHLNGLANMLKETQEETGQLPILKAGHPQELRYLGTVNILTTHDRCVFQRQIRVHTGGLENDAVLTDEVSAHLSLCKNGLIEPPKGVVLQSHVPPVIGYVLAHDLNHQPYINLAEMPIKPHARGSLGDIKARFVPYPYDPKQSYDIG